MSEKQTPQENPGSQYEKHEQQAPTVENFEDAMQYTADLISDFSLIHSNGVNVKDGAVTPASLHQGVEKLIKEIESEEADPNLEKFVTQLAQTSADGPRYPKSFMQNPMISFLVSRGAYEKEQTRSYPEPESKKPYREKSIRKPQGNQIIADGRTVRGDIVPGVGVRTEKGILRTRGTPRLGNS